MSLGLQLVEASRSGNIDVLKRLLDEGADVEQGDEDGDTLIHLASWKGHTGCVELLLSYGCHLESRGFCGRTPLLSAASGGRIGTMQLLLDKGANKEDKDNDNNTALHLAAQFGTPVLVDWLLSNGLHMESRGFCGRTPLLSAASRGNIGTMRLLLRKGANKEYKDNNSETALHLAAQLGTPDSVDWLLSNRFHLECRGLCDRTPLLSAASGGKIVTMQLLLDRGANKEDKDNDNNTALHLAAQFGTPDSVDWLLRNGFHLEIRGFCGRTPLLSAASRGNIGTMCLLLHKGANKEDKDNDNNTALHLAAQFGTQDSVDWLLSNGFHLESRGWNDNTPLISAAANGRADNVRALLNHGADITCINRDGKPALDLARGHLEVFNILAGTSHHNVLMSKFPLDEMMEIYPDAVGGYKVNLAKPMSTQGGFGTVYRGIRTSDKRSVVMKKRIYDVNEEAFTGHPHLEAEAMRCTRQHKNVVQFLDSIETPPGVVYLVTEYCNMGSLTDCMTELKPKLSIKVDWMLQITEGLNFMHSRITPVAHRDLKPDNILAHREDGQITMKLADFGFAKLVETTVLSTICGTEQYMAPEVTPVDGYVRYTIASDIFSLGLVYSVILRFLPSNPQLIPAIDGLQMTEGQTVASIMRDKYKASKPVPALFVIHESDPFVEQRLKHLILTMATLKPDNRITIDIVLYELRPLAVHPLLK